jgi:hypothetical protein
MRSMTLMELMESDNVTIAEVRDVMDHIDNCRRNDRFMSLERRQGLYELHKAAGKACDRICQEQ